MARRDVGSVIKAGCGDGNGKFAESTVGEKVRPLVNFFHHRTVADNLRFQAVFHGVKPPVRHLLCLTFETQAVDARRTGQAAHQGRTLVFSPLGVGHILKEKGPTVLFL